MRRILITGSRSWEARTTVWSALNAELQQFGSLVIVHGGARGADDIADRWAWGMLQAGHDVRTEPHAPQYERYPLGRSLGVFDAGASVCHAFPAEGDPVARHLMARAYAAEIPVVNHGWQAYTTEAQEFAEAYLKTTPKTRKAYL